MRLARSLRVPFTYLLFAASLAVILNLAAPSASAAVVSRGATISGIDVQYKVVLPNGYDPAKAYPAVLAFPSGGQEWQMVGNMLEINWRQQAETRGYIVIMPAAPDGQLFFEGGARVFPGLLDKLLGDYKILGNKFHIAGRSNGGLSAFYIASLYPKYFWSVTGLPGFLENDATPEHLKAFHGLCVYMYAGGLDTDWLNAEKNQVSQFHQLGYTVEFSEEPGQPHAIGTLTGQGSSRLFDQFEKARQPGACAK